MSQSETPRPQEGPTSGASTSGAARQVEPPPGAPEADSSTTFSRFRAEAVQFWEGCPEWGRRAILMAVTALLVAFSLWWHYSGKVRGLEVKLADSQSEVVGLTGLNGSLTAQIKKLKLEPTSVVETAPPEPSEAESKPEPEPELERGPEPELSATPTAEVSLPSPELPRHWVFSLPSVSKVQNGEGAAELDDARRRLRTWITEVYWARASLDSASVGQTSEDSAPADQEFEQLMSVIFSLRGASSLTADHETRFSDSNEDILIELPNPKSVATGQASKEILGAYHLFRQWFARLKVMSKDEQEQTVTLLFGDPNVLLVDIGRFNGMMQEGDELLQSWFALALRDLASEKQDSEIDGDDEKPNE